MRNKKPTASHNAAGRPYSDVIVQYLSVRDAHPGIVLLYRIGSFYETLFEDAELVSEALGLKLGDRPSGGSAPPVPQCGFTHTALDTYLSRLLARGYRVAVCEETEPSEGDGVRTRAVVRTLTPGTVSDPRLLREDRPTYLAALVAPESGQSGLAWSDVAAGEFRAGVYSLEDAAAEIERLDPAEILIPVDMPVPDWLRSNRVITRVGTSEDPAGRLQRAFPGISLSDLPAAEQAAGLIVGYLQDTHTIEDSPPLESPRPAGAADSMRLDAATQRHLELVQTARSSGRAGSLLDALDRSVTPMGRRMLRDWLLRPLTDLTKIAVRHRIIGELMDAPALRAELIMHLRAVADLERLAGRAASRKTTIDDLRALSALGSHLETLRAIGSRSRSPFLRALGRERPSLSAFSTLADAVIGERASGEIVKPTASPALAAALTLKQTAVEWQTQYLAEIQGLPGLAKTRLERTSTQGLFLEVPANTRVPPDWIRRGGLARVERYTTELLDTHAVHLADAEETIAHQTRILLDEVRTAAVHSARDARELARHLAAADALAGLAEIASQRAWVLPIVDDGPVLDIVGGRHPVLEGIATTFQPNDAHLVAQGTADQLVVLTGPNMAGKSTWMRQVALIVLLAQMGSYVPATSARIGLVDAIFTRIGAVDDLAQGRSTFMVEMAETASVLGHATNRSLVILDEIGRGTSTHDGMSIAWAVVEFLADGPVRPRTIAATHYHELAALRALYPSICLLQAAVQEGDSGIVFPHRIVQGAADRSFGIEVARLAGLPSEVLNRARQLSDVVEPLTAEIAARLTTAMRREADQQ